MQPKVKVGNIGGNVVKDTEVYRIQDNTDLKNLVVSSTLLHPQQSTRGHSHPGQEEVYTFISGSGKMQLGDIIHEVTEGDLILIEDGVFHKVINDTSDNLYFVCVFDGKRNH